MERVNRIITDPVWKAKMEEITSLEWDRKFCGHGVSHLLDVARIACIDALEREIPEKKEIIYAAALLHDVGRGEQYLNGTPHEIAGQPIAREISERAGFSEDEAEEIAAAVGRHRDKSVRDDAGLSGLIYYRADKKSRMCCLCPAEKECSWSDEKKKMSLTV